MKLFKYLAFLLAIVAFLSPVLAFPSDSAPEDGKKEKYVDHTDKTLPARKGGTLKLSTDRGSVKVLTWDRNEVRVVLDKEVEALSEESAQEIFIDFGVRTDAKRKDVHIRAGSVSKSKDDFLKIKFELTVPDQYSVDIRTSKGSVSVGDLNGKVKVKAEVGSIQVGHIKNGQVDIETAKGDLIIQSIQNGEGRAETSKGAIKVDKASGDLRVEAREGGISIGEALGEVHAETYGDPITIGMCSGYLHVETGGGDFKVNEARFEVHVETDGGDIEIGLAKEFVKAETFGGNITLGKAEAGIKAETGGGNISIGSVKGDIKAETGGGSITIGKAHAKVEAETGAGDIVVTEAGGPVEVETAGGSVLIQAAHGYIEAENKGGSIEARMIVADKEVDTHCKLEASEGDVILYLPKDLAATIDAEIIFRRRAKSDYRIYSDFPIAIQFEDTKKLTGKGEINGGGHPVKITAVNGDIHIKKIEKV